jgi:cation:H+ antiporter
MTEYWIWICFSLALLYYGAEGLVRGSSSLALRFGITPLVVGLTVVAMGTSAPEVLVSVKAALSGQGDLAVGNVIGSNIFNIGAILGLTALIAPMRVQLQLLKFDAPIMLGVCCLTPLLLLDHTIRRWEGALLFSGIILYLAVNVWVARRTASPEVKSEYAEGVPPRSRSAALDFAFILGGLGLLVFGARLLTDNAILLARAYGVTEAVIGLTIVAAGTSVPELAASLVAALRKESDIAIGNVIGSNIFNVLSILGIGAIAAPLAASQIRMADIFIMLGFCAALIPILWTGLRVSRLEGALLFTAFLGYMTSLWPK